MTFITRTRVRFAHVDPAGIVFYPRYFEMVNAALEDFFAEVVGMDFHSMHIERSIGVPTVKLESDFVGPSRLGEMLDIAVSVERVGASSATLVFNIRCGGEKRVVVRSVIVCMDLTSAKSIPWPAELRAGLARIPSSGGPSGMLSSSDRPEAEEVLEGMLPGTLDSRG